MLAEELWSYLPQFGRDYAISNLGRVTSYKHLKPRIISAKLDKDGYRIYRLCSGGDFFYKRAARLVAESFLIDKPPSMDQVNHKDGNKLNDRADNLEWANHRTNAIHMYRTGLRKLKFTTDQIVHIKELSLQGKSQDVIATEIGMAQTMVSRILRDEVYSYIDAT